MHLKYLLVMTVVVVKIFRIYKLMGDKPHGTNHYNNWVGHTLLNSTCNVTPLAAMLASMKKFKNFVNDAVIVNMRFWSESRRIENSKGGN